MLPVFPPEDEEELPPGELLVEVVPSQPCGKHVQEEPSRNMQGYGHLLLHTPPEEEDELLPQGPFVNVLTPFL